MKTITLTQNQIALVDDEDFESLNKFKWCAAKNRYGGYEAIRGYGDGKKHHTIRMHRQIMSCPQGLQVDHKNHNKLNNQKTNLRICTNAENQHNSKMRKDNTSGIKGVSWHKGSIYKGKRCDSNWQARISFNCQNINLGLFDSKIEAARAYDQAARKYFGEFACLNFG